MSPPEFSDPANDKIPSVELVCRITGWTTQRLIDAGLDWVSVYRRRWFGVMNPSNLRWLRLFCSIVNVPWVTVGAITGRDYAIARAIRKRQRQQILQQRGLDNQTTERSGDQDVQNGVES